ncbi:tRNA 5-methylaminomethyl-2-thiouridine biosynthesis bifunctional protein MnmC [Legionella massiliensis]|uniref:tRNA 5-methylaminomethyl-2-thiouridine biosynthesis bifunctional protein MnmC n=1 Tax=Legionella massiliensis TaxID=1034943 RepID=A0A078KZ23_9GAMM|nr:bifunctional tRNA (5-methylaminomethyl-2-thiouridine)(34)-methyltransferase MnmD/FAD-dependent 5-carboxymethylaminomethyl-2-thiouridine(34) oxidoreductase MnmC [Legionella massiliensis]CDZ78307.1 tRNA 5-methylaminomethyl-2-thiouridine biosynthesis bifunctional protein MnmC [Legionella massiliensis]CEE14045.1 tRNA 5-methylaminomethyl-2-thiouridine biosynthesis bifunctional protein MnmC [Legionella massiliensis]
MSHPFIPIEKAQLLWQEGLPRSQVFDDIYFSAENGLAETQHVFIEGNQLIKRWQALHDESQDSFIIAETGFGSGLNFLLTWALWMEHAPQNVTLHFFSCEKYPLAKADLQRCLDLWPQLSTQAKSLVEQYPVLTPGYHRLQFAGGRVNLTLMLGEANDCYRQMLLCGDAKLESQLRSHFVDAWYLDGFSPAKNQQMWSSDLVETIALLSKPGTSLATYSAASLVKTHLEDSGFLVKKMKGFGPKRDMVVAEFQELTTFSKKRRTTPWHTSKTSYKTKKAIVLGAGLAGCYTAHSLAKRGWQVVLLDENSKVGQGASGNRQAVLYPMFSAYRSPLSAFMLSAFQFASRAYKTLLASEPIGELSGILQLAFDAKECQSQDSLYQWLTAYPELAAYVNAQEASSIAGIKLDVGGLFIQDSGWINSVNLCELLANTAGVEWFPNTRVSELIHQDGFWHAAGQSAEVLVIANGYQAKQFSTTAYLPIKPIRGQMTMISANQQSAELKIPLCGDGHILPVHNDIHAFGASYHLGASDKNSYSADDIENLNRLAAMPARINWSEQIKENWVGIRAATTDYLPLVGPVPDENSFIARFSSLSTNARRWLPSSGAYLPGLYLCAGFGSRGLTSVPLCAEWLASEINMEPSLIPQAMIQSLVPSRFLLKSIIRSSK